jgi:hypothetical protein
VWSGGGDLVTRENRGGWHRAARIGCLFFISLSAAGEEPSALEVSGDLRVRGQGDYSDDDARDRHSGQVRARLGATYTLNDRITIGARLVTGDPDDPNSADVQLSNFADDLDFSLDLAYVQFSLDRLTVYAGKLPQPFTRTDLVWDSDVNPQGLSASYSHPLGSKTKVRASSLFFIVDEQAVAADSTMAGVQLGLESTISAAWKYDVAAAYYDYTLGSVAGGDTGDFRTNLRNPDGSYLSDFNLADFLASLTWQGAGEAWPLRTSLEYVRNTGAATEADEGYGMELAFGRASQAQDFRVSYGYWVAETDAVLAAFSHDNTSIATNYDLHSLVVDYVPMEKTLLSAYWYRYKPHDAVDAGTNDPDDWLDRFRLAFQVSF